ncbi:MAG: DUF4097 and DUF4098 domain-containing protein YvlB [Glaciecola sp.]
MRNQQNDLSIKKEVIMKMLSGRIAALVGLSLLALVANAKQSVDETMAADPSGVVDIEHVNGVAKIIGWDKNEVSVKGELGENTEEFKFERDGSSIIIHVEQMKHSGWNNSGGKKNEDNLVIHVPIKSRVNYSSVNADLTINSVHGGVNADVVNGDMEVDDLIGRIRLESVNGDINAKRLNGDIFIETVNGDIRGKHSGEKELKLSTVNGDISVHSDSPEVNAETVNGDIDLELQKVAEIIVSTVNGSIDIDMDLQDDGRVEASSVGGSIDLAFQKGVAARFDLEAHAGGSIKNKITDKKQTKAKYGPRRSLNFSTENPTGTIEVSTVHGRIEVSTR